MRVPGHVVAASPAVVRPVGEASPWLVPTTAVLAEKKDFRSVTKSCIEIVCVYIYATYIKFHIQYNNIDRMGLRERREKEADPRAIRHDGDSRGGVGGNSGDQLEGIERPLHRERETHTHTLRSCSWRDCRYGRLTSVKPRVSQRIYLLFNFYNQFAGLFFPIL